MTFEQALALYDRARALKSGILKRGDREYWRLLADGYLIAKPRAKSIPLSKSGRPDFGEIAKALGDETVEVIRGVARRRYVRLYDRACARVESMRRLAWRAAQDFEVQGGDVWYRISSHYGYQSSGPHYDRGRAQIDALEQNALGLKASVVQDGASWCCEVAVRNELHGRAAKRKGVDMVELVRLCWSKGLNPRVYFPYLPHGFEERHGLDFFGGRKVPAKA